MRVKKCVGVIIENPKGKIFLMRSPKWSSWLIPGGKIEEGESYEDAVHREIREEMGIEVYDLVFLGENKKEPSLDFKKDPGLTFHFIDFVAKTNQTEITPNNEISEYGWFTVESAFKLPLMDSTRNLLKDYVKFKKSK